MAAEPAWRLRDPTLGVWSTQGQGCDTGHGVLTLAATGPLAIGESTGLEITNMAPHLAVLAQAWIGFDDQQWGGLPLPLSLAAIGWPNCYAFAEPVVPIWMSPLGTGGATGVMTLPSNFDFVGLTMYVQGVTWEIGPSRISTSNVLVGAAGVP